MTAGGELLSVRALIDPAAERSFVTRRAASQLNLPERRTSMSIIGLGAAVSSRAGTELCLQVLSPKKSEFKLQTSALILSELTDFLPSKRVNFESWPHIQGLELGRPPSSACRRVWTLFSAVTFSRRSFWTESSKDLLEPLLLRRRSLDGS
ncbi:unnamed protein product [Trichogramma brassicae]|uniref:Peptidase A2 domain-containing protein n=1 Tax=Trichogramma brassicae TaxID=86971 RepID=A0A6H5J2D1_9HYME|nr:unnamed protein product [Trichogramma brassicae]